MPQYQISSSYKFDWKIIKLLPFFCYCSDIKLNVTLLELLLGKFGRSWFWYSTT